MPRVVFIRLEPYPARYARQLSHAGKAIKVSNPHLKWGLLTFNVEGGRSMILSIPSPKEDLTLATVKEKAALIIPVLESSSGAPVTSLKSAKIVETSATVLE